MSSHEKTTASSLSSLSRMMLDSAAFSLSRREYLNALEYLIAVASVDEHPEVTVALTTTVLDIINANHLAPNAISAKKSFLTASGHNIGVVRQILDTTALGYILEIISRSAKKAPHQDGFISNLVEGILNISTKRDVESNPDKEIKFISKSNSQIKFQNLNKHLDITSKLITLLSAFGAKVISKELSVDQKKATRKDTYFDKNLILSKSAQSVAIRTYITNPPKSPVLMVKIYEKANTFGKYDYLSRQQYRVSISDAEANKFLRVGLSQDDLSGYFPDLSLVVRHDEILKPVGDVFIRRSVIRFELDTQSCTLSVDKFYYYDRKTDKYSETFVEVEIDCSEAGTPSTSLNTFLEVIESVLELEPQPKSKYTRFIDFRRKDKVYDYHYFIGIDLITHSFHSPDIQKQVVQRFHKIVKDSVSLNFEDREILIITPMGDGAVIGLNCDWTQIERLVKHIKKSIENNNKEDPKRNIEYKMAVHFGAIFRFTDLNNCISVTGEGLELLTNLLRKSPTGKFLLSEQAFNKISETKKIKDRSQKSFSIQPNGRALDVYEYRFD